MVPEDSGSDDRTRLAFRLAYDGCDYHGFQRQPDVHTIENALFSAIDSLGLADEDGNPVGYAAAGRTDAGVSALAQTVSLRGPAWLTPAALNAELPADSRAWGRAVVPDTFHPRYDATRRTYTYYLPASGIDLRLARFVCGALEGTHDFHNLTVDEGTTVRSIAETTLDARGPFLRLGIAGDGFLRQQVRRIATLVRLVGRGERPRSFVDRVLSEEILDGPDGIPPSAPESLVLTDVEYPEISFDCDPDVRDRARASFVTARRDHAARSRAMGAIAAGLGGTVPRIPGARDDQDDRSSR